MSWSFIARQLIAILLIAPLHCAPIYHRVTTIPADCNDPDNAAEAVWCVASAPTLAHEEIAIRPALRRMASRGGSCDSLAQLLLAMLAARRVRLYAAELFPEDGAVAPLGGGVTSYLLLSTDLIAHFADSAHASANVDSHGVRRPLTLQGVLAHEADHLLGRGHLDADGYLTANSDRCGDAIEE